VKIASIFDKFNFDMMKALVEEMNRYDETPEQALELLNAKVEYANKIVYKVTLLKNGQQVDADELWHGNPLLGNIYIDYEYKTNDSLGEEVNSEVSISFTPEDLVAMDPVKGTMTFSKLNYDLVLTKSVSKKVNIFDIAF
jgi:hypothetical protein